MLASTYTTLFSNPIERGKGGGERCEEGGVASNPGFLFQIGENWMILHVIWWHSDITSPGKKMVPPPQNACHRYC